MGKKRVIARYVLPEVIDPEDTICIQVLVPNERYHLAAFMGQIYALGSASQWQNDPTHKALDVAAVWWKIFNNLRHCVECADNSGVDEGIEQMIRQNPSNPCELQSSIDGTHWCTFADLSLCIPSVNQPGSGAKQPPAGGGQACYHANMQASGKWLLPTLVNTGDVIQVTNYQGAASDGTVSWYCGNGGLFQLGACFGSGSTSSGDPLNSVSHMKLIAKIGSTYYDMYNATFTVPSGVTAQQVEFQLNDSNIADNYGSVAFDVCVTNNSAATWSKTFDFTAGDGLFTSDAANGGGVYTPGIGWQSNNASTNTFGIHRTGLANYTITQAEYHVTPDNPTGGAQLYGYGGTGHNMTPQGYSGTTPVVKLLTGGFTETGGTFGIGMDGTNKTGGKTQTITKAVLSGTGVSPF